MRVRQAAGILVASYSAFLGAWLLTVNPGGESGSEWTYAIAVVSATVLGLFLTLRRPDNSVSFLVVLTGASTATLGLGNYLVPMAVEAGAQDMAIRLVQISDGAWIAMYVIVVVLLPLWFPTGRALTRRWAWVGWIAIATGAAVFLSLLWADEVCLVWSTVSGDCNLVVKSPWGIDGFAGLETLLLVTMPMALPAIVSAFLRWRRSRGDERQQLKWFFAAASLPGVVVVASFEPFGLSDFVIDLTFGLALTAVFVSITLAILRYRLYDIDRFISRTVTYAAVAGLLGLVYFGLVTALTVFLPSDDPLAVAIATLVVAALFNPARKRVRDVVDRRFNRSRYDAEHVIEEFATSLRHGATPDDVVDGWVGAVGNAMHPALVSVWLRD